MVTQRGPSETQGKRTHRHHPCVPLEAGTLVHADAVDCDREDGMEAVITDPNGKVLCPLQSTAWRATVANKCDCLAFGIGPGEGSRGSSFVSASSWNPGRGLYRIQVKGLASSRIVVCAGAQFSRQPHWAAGDTASIGPGDELAWMAKWGSVTPGDSTRVTLQRVGSSPP